MRADMYELIIERPRAGGGRRREAPRLTRFDEDLPPPLRESTSRGRGGTKSLNENLAPLRRFLLSQVGRLWNKVFSEISASLSTGNPVQQHVRDHLDDFVARHVVEIDGTLFARRRWGWLVEVGAYRDALYVCPRTGLLRRVPVRRRSRRQSTPPIARVVDDQTAYIEANGGWFHLELRRVSAGLAPFDVVLRRAVTGGDSVRLRELYGDGDSYAVTKRQLSRRDVDRLALAAAIP